MHERVVRHHGIEHRWLERGDGPPVVLVHGIPTSPELWRHVAPRLSGVRVLAWEMPGYGRSWRAGLHRDISIAAQAGHLLAWMDAVGIERAVLAGHDIGGGVVQVAAVRAPARCAGLFVADTVAYGSWLIPEVRAIRTLGPLVERLPMRLFRAQFGALVARGHDDEERAAESVRIHLAGYDHREGPRALVRQMRSLAQRDTRAVAPQLASLDVAAGVLWGADDPFQKLRHGRRLAADLRAPIDEIAGGRHFTPEDHADRVAAGIQGVIERAERAG